MFELLAVAQKAHHYVRLNREFKSDLQWWITFLAPLNGAVLCRSLSTQVCRLHFTSDVSGSVGCGAIWTPFWLQHKWMQPLPSRDLRQQDSITYQEILPIVLACAVWGQRWSGATVRAYCDNQGAVAVVNSGYSKSPRIMKLLRCMFFIRARLGFHLEGVYLPGRDNQLADAVSRDKLSFLFAQVPQAWHNRTAIPASLLSLLVGDRPDWTSPAWSQLFGSCVLLV